MKKKIYYVSTNAGDYMITDDGEERRILNSEYCECDRDDEGNYIDLEGFVAAVTDDSAFEPTELTVKEIVYGVTKGGKVYIPDDWRSDPTEIIYEAEVDC